MQFKAPHTLALIGAGLLALITGCSKEGAEATAPSAEATTSLPADRQPESTSTPLATAPDTRLAESQAALKARDYERAAVALMTAQRGQLSEQQAAAAAAQMHQLQSSIAAAAAAGDPRAQAAAARLRQAAIKR